MYKILPSYVGSKSYWVSKLQEKYKNRNFIELFCGSAVLSINLAKKAILNDADKYVYLILKHFDEQIVNDVFTKQDYLTVRLKDDWWKYAYCLQKMSFSGVFRYSKNGYNVPPKNIDKICVKDDYIKNLERWKTLEPLVYNLNYYELTEKIFENKDYVLILDPPYENSKASYVNNQFDYQLYWEWVRLNENICKTIIVFDHIENLPFKPIDTKKNRVNGAKMGNVEGYFVFEDSYKSGLKGEILIADRLKNYLIHVNQPYEPDFFHKTGKFYLELKSDYYTMNTGNFFIERYSNKNKKTDGGPWQALNKNAKKYMYFYVKDEVLFVMDTEKMIEILDKILPNYTPLDIRNKTHITVGYKIPRYELKEAIELKYKFKDKTEKSQTLFN